MILICLLFININIINSSDDELKGIYKINSVLFEGLNMKIGNNNYLNLSDKQALFRIVNFEKNIYFIESIYYKLRLGVDSMNELIFFHKDVYNYKNQTIIMWEFIKINNENYIIKNIFNQKLIEINNNLSDFCTKFGEIHSLFYKSRNRTFVNLYEEYQRIDRTKEKVRWGIFKN